MKPKRGEPSAIMYALLLVLGVLLVAGCIIASVHMMQDKPCDICYMENGRWMIDDE